MTISACGAHAPVELRRPQPGLPVSVSAVTTLVERLGQTVCVVAGSPINLKITTREDLRLAEQAMRALPKPKLQGPAHPFANDDMWR